MSESKFPTTTLTQTQMREALRYIREYGKGTLAAATPEIRRAVETSIQEVIAISKECRSSGIIHLLSEAIQEGDDMGTWHMAFDDLEP